MMLINNTIIKDDQKPKHLAEVDRSSWYFILITLYSRRVIVKSDRDFIFWGDTFKITGVGLWRWYLLDGFDPQVKHKAGCDDDAV